MTKCHQQSESHKEVVRQFAVNPQQYIEENSKEFEEGFLNILRQRPANTFYSINSINNELVKDRNVPRLPSTKWPRMQHFLEDIEQRAIIETSEDSKHGTMVKFLSNSTGHPHKRANVQKSAARTEPNYLVEYNRQLTVQSKLLAQEPKPKETQEDNSTDEQDDKPFAYNTFEIKAQRKHSVDGNPNRDLHGASEVHDSLGKRAAPGGAEDFGQTSLDPLAKLLITKTSSITETSKSAAAFDTLTEADGDEREGKWICRNAVVQIMDQ